MLHQTTFEYLKPTDEQVITMNEVRAAFKDFAQLLDQELNVGPDKTYILRELRSLAMWANVSITREPDGTPRS